MLVFNIINEIKQNHIHLHIGVIFFLEKD